MNFGPPLKQDLSWCPERKSARKKEKESFQGPFHHITACLEKSGSERNNRWCLMFITKSLMIIMPVPHAHLCPDPDRDESVIDPGPAGTTMKKWISHDKDSMILDRLNTLVRQCYEKEPDEVFIAEHDTDAIPLETIKEITMTWVKSSGRYSRLLFFFSGYPAEPSNASYRVNYQLTVTAGNRRIVVITPFSPELRQTLRDLLGERVREIPDEYAPLL
jgi:hypothetical protein